MLSPPSANRSCCGRHQRPSSGCRDQSEPEYREALCHEKSWPPQRGQLRDGERLTAFVYGTARNIVDHRFRMAARRPPMDPIAPEHAMTASVDPVEQSERDSLVARAHLGRDMTCAEVVQTGLIEEYVAGHLPDAERDALESHLFECALCFADVMTLYALRGQLARERESCRAASGA